VKTLAAILVELGKPLVLTADAIVEKVRRALT
jgi:hypothetical protein